MPEGRLFIEKRKFKRVPKNYMIRYKLMPSDNIIEAMKKDGKSQDISIGGMRIEGEPVGDVGDVIKVEIKIDGREEAVITFAEVKWIRQTEGAGQFGAEFLALKDDDRQELEKIINT
jgi:c-di-GMP-binding flagellar brake protein YcgR